MRFQASDAVLPLVIILTLSLASVSRPVEAQYQGNGGGGGGYEMGMPGGESGTGYDYAGGGGGDERPKINLGIRLKIPAIKVDLPRFSLPKITVSAKIRQPDRPRTITLPEINLDTSSKLAAPNKGGHDSMGYGGYAGGGGYGGSSYGGQYGSMEKTQTFTFSSHGEEHPTSANYNSGYRQQQQQPMKYSGSAEYPSIVQSTQQSSETGIKQEQQQTPVMAAATQAPMSDTKNADLGFNQPVYVEPQPADSRPAVAHYGRPTLEQPRPERQQQPQQEQKLAEPMIEKVNPMQQPARHYAPAEQQVGHRFHSNHPQQLHMQRPAHFQHQIHNQRNQQQYLQPIQHQHQQQSWSLTHGNELAALSSEIVSNEDKRQQNRTRRRSIFSMFRWW